MKTRVCFALFCIFQLLAVHSCTGPANSGGTGTETVNTFALLPDGTPAAGATAKIVEDEFWIDRILEGESPVIHETVADEGGFISLCIPEQKGRVNLQIDHCKGSLLLSLPAGTCLAGDTIRLKPNAAYGGSLPPGSSIPDRVVLSGTSYDAHVNNTGTFFFKKVAAGPYGVVCMSGHDIAGTGALTLEAGNTVIGERTDLPPDRILIDNFESGVGPTALGHLFPKLGWYVLSDSLHFYWDAQEAGWAQGTPSIIGRSPISYDSTDDGNGGRAFTFSTTLDPHSPYANALVGISFKKVSEHGIDLSGMTGFSLRLSGEGVLRIRFESYGLDNVSLLSHYTYEVELTETMKQITIPVDSLTIIEPFLGSDYYHWNNESKYILRVEFELSVNSNPSGKRLTCTFDDFYINGITVNDLLPRLQ